MTFDDTVVPTQWRDGDNRLPLYPVPAESDSWAARTIYTDRDGRLHKPGVSK
jgi:hypothetical protein